MIIVQINAVCESGSTGMICQSVSDLLSKKGVENYVLYTMGGKSAHPLFLKYSNKWYTKLQSLKSRVFGNYGFNSKYATRRLIKELERIKPSIVHLHNLHSQNCNLEMLFKYLKKTRIKIFWTFHDCWAFTGYCPHFDMIGCDKWKNGCYECPLRKEYSWFFDKSKKLYKRKNELLNGLDLTIISPSEWLGRAVKESFLKDYEVKVINNGIDLEVFKPTESNFKEKYGLQDKHIVLGVAFGWGPKKGLDCFIELSKRLPESYQIVLVGTDTSVDKQLPDNVISIHKTQNQRELAEIYTAADVFVNCTREENFPTVNIEALACGTPVITFDTGGSSEIVDKSCGSVVPKNDIKELQQKIVEFCKKKPLLFELCLERSKNFEDSEKFLSYLQLYRESEQEQKNKV
ncbi:MAG: glycosyltransferase [Clostridia bacterium]|nr:glycosyltransferase [Clostridia bacterium]